MKNKINRFTYLPEQLLAELSTLSLSKTNFNHSLRFLDLLRRKSFKKYGNHVSYISLSYEYLSTVFGHNYNKKWLSILESNKIIIVNNSYYTDSTNKCNSFSKSYCINPYFFSSIDNKFHAKSYMSPLFEGDANSTEYEYIRKRVIEDLKSLSIDTTKLLSMIDNRVNNLSISEFRVNDQIQEQSFRIIATNSVATYQYRTTKANAIAKANEQGKSVIQDKTHFYLMDETEFINMKKVAIKAAYTESVIKLEKEYWFAARNTTNNRLDTNITNLCGLLMDEICKDNNLIQIDLKNSQFAILAYILGQEETISTTSDFKAFKALAASGELYTHIQQQLGLNSRKEAKTTMFELLFSSHNNHTTKKTKLKAIFPNVINWIDNYKKANGYEQFSIMLQKKESELFIDNIWKDLKKDNVFALTKHDSVIIKPEDFNKVHNHMKTYFDTIGLECTLEITQANTAPLMTVVEPAIQTPAYDFDIEFARKILTLVVKLLEQNELIEDDEYSEVVLKYYDEKIVSGAIRPETFDEQKTISILAKKFEKKRLELAA